MNRIVSDWDLWRMIQWRGGGRNRLPNRSRAVGARTYVYIPTDGIHFYIYVRLRKPMPTFLQHDCLSDIHSSVCLKVCMPTRINSAHATAHRSFCILVGNELTHRADGERNAECVPPSTRLSPEPSASVSYWRRCVDTNPHYQGSRSRRASDFRRFG